jgi:hypothetical protein
MKIRTTTWRWLDFRAFLSTTAGWSGTTPVEMQIEPMDFAAHIEPVYSWMVWNHAGSHPVLQRA